jgi:ABC-type multidrug transport system fused ATPase/permease subunit
MPPGDLVTLVSEALDGLTVIQAYGKQAYFVQVTSDYINDAHRTLFGSESLNLWLAFYCDFYGELVPRQLLAGLGPGGLKPPTLLLHATGAAMVLAVACFAMGDWKGLGSANVGLAFSQSIQMLVFYTWSIRLLADSIGLFGSVEKLSWLANHAPQEGGRLAPPPDSSKGSSMEIDTVGKDLPKHEARIMKKGICLHLDRLVSIWYL